MRLTKKICIFALLCALLITILSVSVLATDVDVPLESENAESVVEENGDLKVDGKLPMNLKVDDFGKRLEIVLEGFVTGMLAVFAVLALLWGIFTVTGFIFKKPGDKKAKATAKGSAPVEAPAPAEVEVPVVAEEQTDDGEIAAVITAAIAAMIESGDYKNEFVGGFRVVSFKRSANSAWNKK